MDRYPFDAEYLRRLREGDPTTVDHFYRYFTGKLSIKLYQRRFSKSDRDDIIQETFIRFFERLQADAIRSPESLGAWIFRTCDHVVSERYRIDQKYIGLDDDKYTKVPDRDPNIEELLLQGEEDEVVRQTLKLLTPKEREIIVDIYDRRRPKDEICAEHQCSRDYLRVVLHRAVTRFRFLYPNEKGKPRRRGRV